MIEARKVAPGACASACWTVCRRAVLACLIVCVALSAADGQGVPAAQPRAMASRADQLLAEIQRIMKSTDWTNEAAVSAAEGRIKSLTDEYEREVSKAGAKLAVPKAGATPPTAAAGQAVLTPSSPDLASLIDRAAAAGDEVGDFLMAEPVQKQIVAEFKEQVAELTGGGGGPVVDLPVVIDVAGSDARRLVGLLAKNTVSSTLIVTSSRPGQGMDAATVLAAAARMPLRELYLVNLGSSLTVLPSAVLAHQRLERLSLYNNALLALPDGITGLRALRRLDIDVNPIGVLPTRMSLLARLKELNLVKTRVDSAELRRLRSALPSCTIRIQ